MRIIIKHKKKIRAFTKRVITKFAWLPIVVKNSHTTEIRWFRRVTIEQRYRGEIHTHFSGWENLKFIDDGK